MRGWYSRRLEHLEPTWWATWASIAVGLVEIVALLWPVGDRRWPSRISKSNADRSSSQFLPISGRPS